MREKPVVAVLMVPMLVVLWREAWYSAISLSWADSLSRPFLLLGSQVYNFTTGRCPLYSIIGQVSSILPLLQRMCTSCPLYFLPSVLPVL